MFRSGFEVRVCFVPRLLPLCFHICLLVPLLSDVADISSNIRMCWTLAEMGHIGGVGFHRSHIWSCCSLQNRPPAVQRSPHNGPPPPCMNPALTNTSWVRETGGMGYFLTFFFSLLPFSITAAFTNTSGHVVCHSFTCSPQYVSKLLLFLSS